MTSTSTAAVPRRAALFLTAGLTLLGTAACGGSTGPGGNSSPETAGPTTPNTILIKNFTFEPDTITVSPGTKITVINQDSATHTLTANDKSFDTTDLAGHQQTQITAPTRAGSYPYICQLHQYMTGTLLVR